MKWSDKTSVKFTVFTDEVDRLFFSDQGPVGQFTHEAAKALKAAAISHIGTDYSGDHPGRRLRNSGRVESLGRGLWQVVFEHRAAQVHYFGAKPHNMTVGKVYQRTTGAEPFGPRRAPFHKDRRRVDHPGHAANPYLEKGARDIGLVLTQRPTGLARRGFARIPRGFA